MLVIAGFIIAAAPWWARNRLETGSFGFMPTKGVFNLWQSTADAVTLANEMGYDVRRNPRGSFAEVEKKVNYPQALYSTCVVGKTEIQRAASLREQTVKFILANPGLTVKRYFRHLLDFFNPLPYFGNRLLKVYLATTYIIILLISGLGIAAAQKNKKGIYPLIVYAMIFILIAGWFRLGFRFRIPLMPVFMLTAGYYFSLLFKAAQKSNAKNKLR